jgi:hypothetical protein
LIDILEALPGTVLLVGWAPFIEPEPCLALLLGVAVWAALVRRNMTDDLATEETA